MRLNLTTVENAKQAVRSELDAIEERDGPEARRQAILNAISDLDGQLEPQELLDRYVYTVSALVHCVRFGGFSDSEVKELLKLGRALLQLLGIDRKSKLSVLHNDLHAIESQILRQHGSHWQALWHQLMAGYYSRKDDQGPSFQAMLLASRALRLGNADLAISYYNQVDQADLPPAKHAIYLLGKIKAHRLAAKTENFATMLEEARALNDLTDTAKDELLWEEYCWQASATGDLTRLVAGVQRGKQFFFASYYLEAFFWSAAVPVKKWQTRFVRMETLSRNKAMDTGGQGVFFKAAIALEQSYDSEIPLTHRIAIIGDTLEKSSQVIGVDKELLCWLAFSRSLARQGALELAAATFFEYRSLSFKLSGGRSPDVLGIAADLFEKPWLQAI